MKVLWTDAAVAQLEAIQDYLAQTSPEYARRVVDLESSSDYIHVIQNSWRDSYEYSEY